MKVQGGAHPGGCRAVCTFHHNSSEDHPTKGDGQEILQEGSGVSAFRDFWEANKAEVAMSNSILQVILFLGKLLNLALHSLRGVLQEVEGILSSTDPSLCFCTTVCLCISCLMTDMFTFTSSIFGCLTGGYPLKHFSRVSCGRLQGTCSSGAIFLWRILLLSPQIIKGRCIGGGFQRQRYMVGVDSTPSSGER